MSFTLGALNVFRRIQDLHCSPFYLDSSSPPALYTRPSFIRTCSTSRRLRRANMTFFHITMFIYFYKLYYIFLNWSNGSGNRSMEQVAVYIILPTANILGLIYYRETEKFCSEICYITSQRFQLLPENYYSKKNYPTAAAIKEHCVYILSAALLSLLPLAVAGLVIFRNHDPLLFIMTNFLSFLGFSKHHFPHLKLWLCKVIIAAVYGLSWFHCMVNALASLLVMLMVGEGVELLSYRLLPSSTSGESFSFNKNYKLFRQLQLIIGVARTVTSRLLAFQVGTGILLGATSTFCALMFYDRLPLPIYLANVSLSCSAFVVTFVLFNFAAVPNINGNKFKSFWKREDLTGNRSIRRILRSCPPIGYRIGDIPMVKKSTSLTICDSILSAASEMVLMQAEL